MPSLPTPANAVCSGVLPAPTAPWALSHARMLQLTHRVGLRAAQGGQGRAWRDMGEAPRPRLRPSQQPLCGYARNQG